MRALLFIALALTACGASQRQDTIKTALVSVDASKAAFLAFESTAEQAIIDHATSGADGAAKLTAFRADRVTINNLFNAAYHAIAAAATANDDQSVASMQTAMGLLVAAVSPYLGGSK